MRRPRMRIRIWLCLISREITIEHVDYRYKEDGKLICRISNCGFGPGSAGNVKRSRSAATSTLTKFKRCTCLNLQRANIHKRRYGRHDVASCTIQHWLRRPGRTEHRKSQKCCCTAATYDKITPPTNTDKPLQRIIQTGNWRAHTSL